MVKRLQANPEASANVDGCGGAAEGPDVGNEVVGLALELVREVFHIVGTGEGVRGIGAA